MNSRHAKMDHEDMLKMHAEYEKHLARLQEEEDEKEIRFAKALFFHKALVMKYLVEKLASEILLWCVSAD